MPNVIAIFPGHRRDFGACEIYRTTMPYYYLQKKHPEWKTSWAFIEDILDMSKSQGTDVIKEVIQTYDLFVFPRLYFTDPKSFEAFQVLIESLNYLGKKAIYEVDDDMSNDTRVVVDGDAISAASLCNAITVTTPYLAWLMHMKTGKKTYILPNMFGPDAWYEKLVGTFRYSDRIVLGLTGSSTHNDDWKVLETVLPDLLLDDRIHLILMGYHPDYLKDLPNSTLLPGMAYEKYTQVIQSCDIILAPLNDDAFNLSKSPIKCIEGMAARRILGGVPHGAACIASNHPVYQLAITSEKNGLLVEHTPEGWKTGLERLINDQALRNKLQFSGHEWVDRHHNITKTVSLWRNVYNSVIQN